MASFGMNPNDKMIFNQFYEIITKDKTYPEVNKIRSRIEKAKQLKKLFQMEKDKEGEVKGEGEGEGEGVVEEERK
jgi:hypothetical protein